MWVPDHLIYHLRNLYKGQEATNLDMEQNWLVQNWELLPPCLFKLYAEYIMWNARLDESQAGIKFARRNINNVRNADNTTLMAENEEKLRCL